MSAIRLVVLVFVVTGCASTPPEEPDDVCKIFSEKPKWYRAVNASYKSVSYTHLTLPTNREV